MGGALAVSAFPSGRKACSLDGLERSVSREFLLLMTRAGGWTALPRIRAPGLFNWPSADEICLLPSSSPASNGGARDGACCGRVGGGGWPLSCLQRASHAWPWSVARRQAAWPSVRTLGIWGGGGGGIGWGCGSGRGWGSWGRGWWGRGTRAHAPQPPVRRTAGPCPSVLGRTAASGIVDPRVSRTHASVSQRPGAAAELEAHKTTHVLAGGELRTLGPGERVVSALGLLAPWVGDGDVPDGPLVPLGPT